MWFEPTTSHLSFSPLFFKVHRHTVASESSKLNCMATCPIYGLTGKIELGPTWVQNSGQTAPFSSLSSGRATESTRFMERAMGIEPTSEAWEASILPLYDARSLSILLIIHE